ncbi:hypothetical protein C8J56DRAFT_944964, partial [Mycena floridula]
QWSVNSLYPIPRSLTFGKFHPNWLALFLAQSIRALVQLLMISVRLFPSTTSSLMPAADFMPLDTSSTETMTVNNDAILFTVGPRKELFRIYKKDCVLRPSYVAFLLLYVSLMTPFSRSRMNADWDLTILIQCQIDNTHSYPWFEDGSRLHRLRHLHVIHIALRRHLIDRKR